MDPENHEAVRTEAARCRWPLKMPEAAYLEADVKPKSRHTRLVNRSSHVSNDLSILSLL